MKLNNDKVTNDSCA